MTEHDFDFSGESHGRDVHLPRVYHFDDTIIRRRLLHGVPPRLADLVDVAVAAYVADRLARRRFAASRPEAWPRRMVLRIPVRDSVFWTARTPALTRLLDWLTDDRWEFEFTVSSREARGAEVDDFLFHADLMGVPEVALFSGGLDSLAGADLLLQRGAEQLLLVGLRTSSRQAAAQKAIAGALAVTHRHEVASLHVPLQLAADAEGQSQERTQRSRAFAHLAIGSTVAWLAGSPRLVVCENGPGAINLPYLESQIGAMATKAVRPETLSQVSALFCEAVEDQFQIANIGLLSTKAELCRGMTDSSLALVAQTNSCDSFPLRETEFDSCGFCTSCILRRQALAVAGLSRTEDVSRYQYDINTWHVAHHPRYGFPLAAMLGQVANLNEWLNGAEPHCCLAAGSPSFAHLTAWYREQSDPQFALRDVVSMLKRYVDEWMDWKAPRLNEFCPPPVKAAS